MALVVTFFSTAEGNCRNVVFPVCIPDDELLKGYSRPVTAPIFCEVLNLNNVELGESKKIFVASTFSDELNSEDSVDGKSFVSGELRPDPTRLSVLFPCIAELTRQEGEDDCTCCNDMELIREYKWLDCICCIDDKLDKESMRGT